MIITYQQVHGINLPVISSLVLYCHVDFNEKGVILWTHHPTYSSRVSFFKYEVLSDESVLIIIKSSSLLIRDDTNVTNGPLVMQMALTRLINLHKGYWRS